MSGLKQKLKNAIEKRWYSSAGALLFLLPLEWLFSWAANRHKIKRQAQAYLSEIPTIVVGNISIGGTGKTPAIIALIKHLQTQGYKPAVVSRGYGRQTGARPRAQNDSQSHLHSVNAPIFVDHLSTASQVGDEPLLIFQSCQHLEHPVSVVVCHNRVEAVKALETEAKCNIILCDDGMQHYALGRHKELVLIDGLRMLGNEHQLPVGPLREGKRRLANVDWVVVNQPVKDSGLKTGAANESSALSRPLATDFVSYHAYIAPVSLTRICDGKPFSLEQLHFHKNWTAIAGLGNPEKFFQTLEGLGLQKTHTLTSTHTDTTFEAVPFPDHHKFCEEDFTFVGQKQSDHAIVMTSKDAVKCRNFAKDNWYQLDIEMILPEAFLNDFSDVLAQLVQSKG